MLETDSLNFQRDVLLGLGYLAQDLLGVTTIANGLLCTPTSPASLNVQIGAGRIYSLQNVDNTDFSTVPMDTAHQVVKQGILMDAVTLACPAPGTAGQSINYLIEAAYQDVDTTLIALPYYNSANPAQTFSGPNNNATPQATQRQGQVALQIKAGTAATTGTQTTPAPDSGAIGLWVVTVANGATTVTSGNISVYDPASFLTPPVGAQVGKFTMTATGFSSTAPSGTAFWRIEGQRVTLAIPVLSGTSNATTFTANIPAAIIPTTFTGALNQTHALALAQNNSAYVAGAYVAVTGGSGMLQFGLLGSLAGWTGSGTKSVTGEITYLLS